MNNNNSQQYQKLRENIINLQRKISWISDSSQRDVLELVLQSIALLTAITTELQLKKKKDKVEI